ncbi:MAG: VWA domain-containing protein [Clostridia bacterium]
MEEKKQIKVSLKVAIIFSIIIILIACGIAICVIKNNKSNKVIISSNGKIDDWQYSNDAKNNTNSGYKGGTIYSSIISGLDSSSVTSGDVSAVESFSASDTSIGFSVGGAKDANNFRENINNGYFPISTDITYNGIFYDYVFDTGKKNESEELFSPSYSSAISNDPISNEKEYYITVGLNSNIKESDFSRKKLNLVVVLDISGSMSSNLDSYYYDSALEVFSKDRNKSKMEIANESVNILIDQLNDDDRFGMVLFDNDAYLGKPLSLVGETDVKAIQNHILEIQAAGGTNFESGYTKATELFKEYSNIDSDEYENRIIVITDAMPNYGTTSKNGLLSYVEENADEGIYTTFIGVGVDFNTELIESITDVKGANYYSVHSSADFKARMGEQFEYMVTPLVFDLKLSLKSEDFEIASVYGSDTVNKENGNIMNVNTLFPSKTTDTGEVKGGVVLLKLNKKTEDNSGSLKLKVSYKDRNGKEYSNSQTVELEDREEYYENTGIRKAILLTRYVNVLKNWILYERSEEEQFIISPYYGIEDCNYTTEEIYRILGENERTSVKLSVSEEYRNTFNTIKEYIEQENKYIKDSDLKQEIELLEKLIKYK